VTLDELRRFAVARSLLPPTTLQRALDALAFVQADPIRAPARAQDLTLRHRVTGYRAGDLERRYARLDVHEDIFINYGFVTSALQSLMHPRGGPAPWSAARGRHVRALLDFVRTHGAVHPRDVDAHFSHGTVVNYWGGSSSATTHLMDAMHYRGLLRVIRREAARLWSVLGAVVCFLGRRRVQVTAPVKCLWSLTRLCVAAIRRHSDRQAALPRRWKRPMPRLNLVWAKTGSIMVWRRA